MMNFRFIKTCCLIISMLLVVNITNAQTELLNQRIKVALRNVGHQMLLSSGDSVSVVLPVTKIKNRYKVALTTPFRFDPSDLVRTVDDIFQQMDIDIDYLVEVEKCQEKAVFYSYEFSNTVGENLIPCGGRILPEACYHIFLTVLDKQTNLEAATYPFINTNSNLNYFLIGGIGLIILLSVFYLWQKYQKTETSKSILKNDYKISIGNYEFDKRSLELTFDNSTVELTSKEADLLITLYNSANEIIEREEILREVWGDEGDYVGRTLDVFISKLRKKLNADENVKIMNIRGVGYKLIF